MSGDVQPRKRKDKRRKKEDEETGTPPPTLVSASESGENVTIHVHKEGGTGGHWCARIIFFSLLAVLIGLIGIIILEHRGTADVGTPVTDSQWATIFDGWVDEVIPLHEDEPRFVDKDPHQQETSKERGGRILEESGRVGEKDQDEQNSEESDNTDDFERDEVVEHDAEDAKNAEHRASDSNESDEDHAFGNNQSDEAEDDGEERLDSEEQQYMEDRNEKDEESLSTERSHENIAPDESDEEVVLEEIENISGEDEENVEKEDPIVNDSDNEIDNSIEVVKASTENQIEDEGSHEFLGIPGINELDDNSAEPLEELEDGDETEEVLDAPEIEPEVEDVEEIPTALAVRFGVGVALVIAAHFVLVKSWNNVENNVDYCPNNEAETPNLSRRTTMVPPLCPTKLIQEQKRDQESEKIPMKDYEHLRSHYDKFEHDNDYESNESIDDTDLWIKRSPLSEDLKWASEPSDKDTSGDEEEDISDEEQLSPTEDEDVDDNELVSKLGTKYGKLPTPSESDDEELEDEEEEDSEGDDFDEEDEDIGGWKRVEVPVKSRSRLNDDNRATIQSSSKSGDAKSTETDDMMNSEDALIRDEIEAGLNQTAAKRVAYFTDALSRHRTSPRLRYEYAKALDDLAEERKDNAYLQRAIIAYEKVLELGNDVTPKLYKITGERCVNRLRFTGKHSRAEVIHKKLVSRFPDEPHSWNQMVVTYLMQNKLLEAKTVLQSTLNRWPHDGFALVHYGFVLKTGSDRLTDAVTYLKAGIDSGHEGTIDGRFYFHLGDALVRLGKQDEAMKVYEDGVKKGLFRSAYQRSLYNVDRLTSRPWWTLDETSYARLFEALETNWQTIRAEGLAALQHRGDYEDEAENLKDTGDWKQFELFARGHKIKSHCAKVPKTCSIIEAFPAAAKCRRGQTKFSVMHPGTHVWPHCGPTNCRLRAHLGLSGTNNTYIRVGSETRSWKEGKVIIFDDSFEHEVWHNGTDTRLVLIVDVWHPELSHAEKTTLPAI